MLDKEVKLMKARFDEQSIYDGQQQVTHCTQLEMTEFDMLTRRLDCTVGAILQSQIGGAHTTSMVNTRQTNTAVRSKAV